MNRRRASLGALAVGATALSLALSPLPSTWASSDAGRVLALGSAAHHGEPGDGRTATGIAATPTGNGYWTVAEDGAVSTHGDARDHGHPAAVARPVVDIAASRTGNGYWLAASDGGVFTFGDARFAGSLGHIRDLVAPIGGIAATPTGNGYWMVAGDGGVFSFGDAPFLGRPDVTSWATAIAATPSGRGYWVVTNAGDIHAFGDARDHGSLAGAGAGFVMAIVPTVTGGGYWLATTDGAVHAFGDAADRGDATEPSQAPAVDLAARTDGGGYWLVTGAMPPPPEPVYQSSARPGEPSDADFDRLAQCESGQRWHLNSGNGYYGGIQFSLRTWRSVGGTGYPHEHSREVQIDKGRELWRRAGWGQWPHCSRQLGYR
jgi:hypothetical protein